MKTLHLTNAFHGSSGGIRVFYQNLLRMSEIIGRKVVLVVPGEENRVEEWGRFGRIHHIKAGRFRIPPFDNRYRVILPYRLLEPMSRWIKELLERETPDLVEICDKYSLWLAARQILAEGVGRGTGTRPTLVASTCERMDDNLKAYLGLGRWAGPLSRWYLNRFLGRYFDHYIANSEYSAREFRDALPGDRNDRISVVTPGVDVDIFKPVNKCSEKRLRLLDRIGGSAASRLILYVGRLSPEKNLGLLVETFRLLVTTSHHDYRLILVGDGPLRNTMMRAFSRFALGKTLFLGHIAEPKQLSDIYANCDLFLHPNPAEPFGMAPLEALASGLPLVACRSGGILSYADDTNSWLEEPLAERFARAVQQVFFHPEPRSRKIAEGLQRARIHSWDRVAERWFHVCDEAHRQRSGERQESLLRRYSRGPMGVSSLSLQKLTVSHSRLLSGSGSSDCGTRPDPHDPEG